MLIVDLPCNTSMALEKNCPSAWHSSLASSHMKSISAPALMLSPAIKREISHSTLLCWARALFYRWLSWLVYHSLLISLVCIASSSLILSPEQDNNDSNSLDLSAIENDVKIFKRASSLDLSWPAPFVPTAPVKINTSLTTAEDIYNLTNLHLAAPRIQCDASTYGRGLNIASCQEAWELLPTSTTRRTCGQRTEGDFDVPLPFKVLSREYHHTRCSAIDLTYLLAHRLAHRC